MYSCVLACRTVRLAMSCGSIANCLCYPPTVNHVETLETTNDKGALIKAIEEIDRTNFVLIVTKLKQVRLIHSCFTVDQEAKNPVVVVVLETKVMAPFRAMTACAPCSRV